MTSGENRQSPFEGDNFKTDPTKPILMNAIVMRINIGNWHRKPALQQTNFITFSDYSLHRS